MNVGHLLTKTSRTYPERPALVYGDKGFIYQETNERVNRFANTLKELGLKKGDRLAIVQRNCHQILETIFACFKAGIAVVPINARLHPKELAYIIEDSGAKALVYSEEFIETVKSIREDPRGVKHFICLSETPGGLDFEKLVSSGNPKEAEVDINTDNLAWIFYTSGTTGNPKGAMWTHKTILTMIMNYYADVYPLTPEDIVLHVAPLTHGSGCYALPVVGKGALNLILEAKKFDPELVFQTIEKKRVTNIAFLTPTMINMLLHSPYIDKYDLSSLRCVVYGGSPMYVEDLKRAVRKMGKIFVQVYGQGEAPMTISFLGREEHLIDGTEEEMARLMSAGIPRTDVEVKIFAEEDMELPSGKMGEIVVRGDIVMKGYWNKPEDTAETLRNGWLHTGDLGMMDDKGYIYIMDRKRDMIISGGINIYPREIEEVILHHPAVYEVAVIGVPDPVWGESVKAIVVLRDETKATEEEIIDFCKEHIASFKKPKSVEFVDSLPKSAYGKILKREIREKYWQGKERKV
jgi:acyl-CoA synthetase (AMP-forming)/AMP-acid ligase II